MRRLAVAVATLLAIAGWVATVPVEAAPRPAAASRGVLGKRTTITWSGAASIRLTVPRRTAYAGGDVDLVVSGGTSYAFVRVVHPYEPGCPDNLGPRCRTDRFTYVRGLHDLDRRVAPSRRHEAVTSLPPVLDAGTVDVFLFTDGSATLTLTTGLRGTYAYRATGRVHGLAKRVRSTCVPLGCASPEGRANGYVSGGESFDLRGAGWAEVYVFGGSGDPDRPSDQVHSIAPCLFPNWQRRDASADPADHPHGCDDVDRPAETANAAPHHANTATPGLGHATSVPWSGARGRQYVGFQSVNAGPTASDPRAYGIWFRFLS